jgi:aminodeoxyfutalosine synthase
MTQGVTALDALAQRVGRGETLTDADAAAILATTDLIAIGALADEVRRRMHGNRTTFCRVLEVPFSALPAALPVASSYGELRIVGAPGDVDSAVRAVAALRALAPSGPLTGFSLADITALASTRQSLDTFFARLHQAGLDAVAEAPVDLLANAADIVHRARDAGLKVLRLSVHALTVEQKVAVACAARDLQAAAGGFRAFAPLPRTMSVAQPTTGYDDVKLVALARLVVANIPSVQVDWPLYGPKLAQVALTMGADDVDGIAAVDSGVLGTRRSPVEEIRGNIRAAALDPVERDGLFELMVG